MRKELKIRIFTFILGAVIFGSIAAYATAQIAASNITYNNTTVDLALDDLYTAKTTTIDQLQSSLDSCNNRSFTVYPILNTNEESYIKLNGMVGTFSKFRVHLNSNGTNANCKKFTTNNTTKLQDINFDTDYSTAIPSGVSDYRLRLEAINSWCSYSITFSN